MRRELRRQEGEISESAGNSSAKGLTVELQKKPIDRLLNRWKQRRNIHNSLNKQGKTGGHAVIASTLGFCIRELEDALKEEKDNDS